MTPTETIAILRQFNEWRRGDEDIPQFDPRESGEAIDAAVEMIDRLEAAESDALAQARLNGMGASREAALMAKLEAAEKDIALKERIIDSLGSELNAVANERDDLLARIAAMEQQEPVAWIGRGPRDGRIEFSAHRPAPSVMRDFSMKPLYLAPGAKGEEK